MAKIQAEFLQGRSGKLFTLVFPSQKDPRGHILFLPGYGEELNRCRHVVSKQAHNFAMQGYNCFVLDYFGTGDSEGELAQADWSTWCADVQTTVQWIELEYGKLPLVYWGLRLGCLLAADVVSRSGAAGSEMLFWQPVTDGRKYLTQLLRQRIAHLVEKGLPGQTTAEMREMLSAGESIEVGGYQLGGQFASELDAVRMGDELPISSSSVHWMQQKGPGDGSLPLASTKVIDSLQAMNNKVPVVTFDCAPVWQLHERVPVQDLHDLTNAIEFFSP